MFKYFPHTKEDIEQMLKVINVKSLDDLFVDVPQEIKEKLEYNLKEPLSEHQLLLEMGEKAQKMLI